VLRIHRLVSSAVVRPLRFARCRHSLKLLLLSGTNTLRPHPLLATFPAPPARLALNRQVRKGGSVRGCWGGGELDPCGRAKKGDSIVWCTACDTLFIHTNNTGGPPDTHHDTLIKSWLSKAAQSTTCCELVLLNLRARPEARHCSTAGVDHLL
jgi:hypothetical protein